MSNKVIYLIIDGLAWQVARDSMGYLLALCEAGEASLYQLESALPSLSRPLYETLLTGRTPVESGIRHNGVQRLSHGHSLFHLVSAAGGTTAAAAYHWISELYNRSPWEARRDRRTDDPGLPIQHGRFYFQDHYPDDHLLLDADDLWRTWQPDLVHHFTIKCVIYGSFAARLAGVARVVNSITGLGFAMLAETPKARLIRPVVLGLYRLALRGTRDK